MIPEYWQDAKTHLIKNDKTLGKIIKSYPDQSIEKRGTAFKTLLRAIVGQQISVKAAESIWQRFISLVGSPTPQKVSLYSVNELRNIGLSMQKANYVLDLSKHFLSNEINPRKFAKLSDQELIAQLIKVKGIGKWTAEMFLIFNLQRPDILPIQDIGLIRAVEKHSFSSEKIAIHQIIEIAETWKPWRTVATWYLWRSLDPLPVEY